MVPRVSASNGKGACNAHALLHAARELRGLLVDGVAQAHEFDKLFHMHIDLGGLPFGPARFHRKGNVFAHRQPGHEGVALKHHATVQAGAHHLAVVHVHVATAGKV